MNVISIQRLADIDIYAGRPRRTVLGKIQREKGGPGEPVPLKKITNLPVEGRVSIDRSMVAALLSTTPRPVPRSSADDLAPPRFTKGSRLESGTGCSAPVLRAHSK